jgi:GGDEF domain-containing protein
VTSHRRADTGGSRLARWRARTDPLTGLPTRRVLLDHLHRGARRGRELGVFVVHLDHAGAEVHREAAERLSALLEPSVPLGRLGADAFGVVLTGGGGDTVALGAATLLASAFDTPFRGRYVDVRVGVALRSGRGDDGAVLLRRAREAAGLARYAGDRVALYEPRQPPRHRV